MADRLPWNDPDADIITDISQFISLGRFELSHPQAATQWGSMPYRVNVPMPTRREMEDAVIIERLNTSLRSGKWMQKR